MVPVLQNVLQKDYEGSFQVSEVAEVMSNSIARHITPQI